MLLSIQNYSCKMLAYNSPKLCRHIRLKPTKNYLSNLYVCKIKILVKPQHDLPGWFPQPCSAQYVICLFTDGSSLWIAHADKSYAYLLFVLSLLHLNTYVHNT